MPKEIWLGPLLGSNRSRLIRHCAQVVSEGKNGSFLYLTASQPLLDLASERILDAKNIKGAFGELPVYLFRGFVRRVLTTAVKIETGQHLTSRLPIDREELPLKRSLISQILKQLAKAGRLKAIGSLAHRDGCVNTVGNLIGEIQRAAKTPEEFDRIIQARSETSLQTFVEGHYPQQDFDREIALIYENYYEALKHNHLTEEDADQLRALSVLRGEWQGQHVVLPWLADTRLLVLDGFFDFTPVQGEILRELVPQVPDVIVNLNSDERNPEIFSVFRETIDQLTASGAFEIKYSDEMLDTVGALSPLRENLFNPSIPAQHSTNTGGDVSNIRLLTCSDRDTEIRTIAKEIKRLVLEQDYSLSQIALVVREKASYAEMIVRIMREESIPCDLELRLDIREIPVVRAARKVFELLRQMAIDEPASLRIRDIADLIKSGYFRLASQTLSSLKQLFEQNYLQLLRFNGLNTSESQLRLEYELGIGHWVPDLLENVVAYVGGELRVTDWLSRARRLLRNLQETSLQKPLVQSEPDAEQGEEEMETQREADLKPSISTRDSEKRRRPARQIHPGAIAWTALLIEHFTGLIKSVPREGDPKLLQSRVLQLLEQLQLYRQVKHPIDRAVDIELPQVMLDLRGLEALCRSLVAAVKSIEICEALIPGEVESHSVGLATFIEEASRGLNQQILVQDGLARRGLRVLEATDVRGLCFRAVFIAGLVEGGFPLRLSRDWMYPHEERERLKAFGLTLEDISPATLLKEEHYFYQAACRATEKLYLTRPALLEDGTETVASYYIDELRRAIAPMEITSEVVRRDFDGNEIFSSSTSSELARALIRREERERHGSYSSRLLQSADIERHLRWAKEKGMLSDSALRRIEIERSRSGRFFGPFDGQITDPNLLKLLEQRFGPGHIHSASGLSLYGNCPYKFFASRILRLEPRSEAALDLQALDAGKLLHDVLRRFFERFRGESLNPRRLDSLRTTLAEIADEVFDEHEQAVPPLNPSIWKLDREIRKVILDQVLLFEVGMHQKTASAEIKPTYFELAFGIRTGQQPSDPNSVPEPLELRSENPQGEVEIQIQGQIDRVDLAADGTLIAYDYKLSRGATTADVRAGRALQLPIYLEALEKLLLPGNEIAGGGYYALRGTERRNRGLYRRDFKDYTGLNARSSLFSDGEWRKIREEAIAKIWDFLNGMRNGRFLVTPSEGYTTCRFCDYSPVCRYDKYRIQGKRMRSGEWD